MRGMVRLFNWHGSWLIEWLGNEGIEMVSGADNELP